MKRVNKSGFHGQQITGQIAPKQCVFIGLDVEPGKNCVYVVEMKRCYILLSVFGAVFLAGCQGGLGPTGTDLPPLQSGNSTLRPVPRPTNGPTSAPAPVKTARTVEEFDTTTQTQRNAALAPEAGENAEQNLGQTIASLGSPTKPGFWMETPLVSAPRRGRVLYAKTGKSVAVDLIPIDGPKTAGSRVSLAALRLLGAPLTGLSEITVLSTH